MDIDSLKGLVQAACAGCPAVENVEVREVNDGKAKILIVQFTDFRPDEEKSPWKMMLDVTNGFEHKVFGETFDCVEILVPLHRFDTNEPDYISKVTPLALCYADHQQYFVGPAFRWNPEDGATRIYGQIRLRGQSEAVLQGELAEQIRSAIGLVYLATFKLWAMQAKGVLGSFFGPIGKQVGERMQALLGNSELD